MEKGLLFGEENRELEILEFIAGGNSYGIDINDIREILPYEENVRKIPNAHPNIEGMVMPRDFLIPIVDIAKSLKLTKVDDPNDLEMLIVTSFNDLNIAVHVERVEGMHRTSTTSVTKPPKKLSTTVKDAVVGVLNINEKKIEILELRNIFASINSDIKLDER